MTDIIDHLEQVIAQRRGGDPETSYVARMAHKGRAKIAQKVGEEAVEAVIAAMADDREGLIGESADLIFHLMMLLAEQGISMAEIRAELERREGISGIAEKASRKS